MSGHPVVRNLIQSIGIRAHATSDDYMSPLAWQVRADAAMVVALQIVLKARTSLTWEATLVGLSIVLHRLGCLDDHPDFGFQFHAA